MTNTPNKAGLTRADIVTRLDARQVPHHGCPYCHGPLVEGYSASKAEMDPGMDGHFIHHVVAFRIGDSAPLGPVECPEGQLGWGAV